MSIVELADIAQPVLDSLPQHIALIDPAGEIQWVNRSWRSFSAANGGTPGKTCERVNYLGVCAGSEAGGDPDAAQAVERIRAVMGGRERDVFMEYPCHSPWERRWFLMRCCPLEEVSDLFVVTHEDITERKLAELRLAELAVTDGLTGLANRRRFDEFLEEAWRRGRRFRHCVSLILLDVDHFKAFNDGYGHLEGDSCLRRVGSVLAGLSRRPDDLVARYGGEEFGLVLGDTTPEDARWIAEEARQAIAELGIPHESSPFGHVTVSLGVATFQPGPEAVSGPDDLTSAADAHLYEAKRAGRDRVCTDGQVHIGRPEPSGQSALAKLA